MKKEVKTSIEGLEVGMFVSRLDRSWLTTDFELEGIHITSDDDITRLRKYCNYVYVNIEAGLTPESRFWVLREGAKSYTQPQQPKRGKLRQIPCKYDGSNEYTALRKIEYQATTRIDTEFAAASQAYEKFGDDFKAAMDSIELDKGIDVDLIKQSISSVVESILHNPGAMNLVVKLKQFDNITYKRSLGTSVLCATFGRHLGLERQDIENLALGGLLLDMGKSKIPLDLLRKPAPLSSEEMVQMRAHVDSGIRMLAVSPTTTLDRKIPLCVIQMIASHHERHDGSGYPQGLTNSEIPIFGRIAGIIDSYDAMTSVRPYSGSKSKSPHEAVAELYELRGTLYQTELVEQFIQTVGLYPTGTLVELNTGEVGAVVAVNGLRRLRPSVMLLMDSNKQPLPFFRFVDLSQSDDSLSVSHGLPSGAYGIDMKAVFL